MSATARMWRSEVSGQSSLFSYYRVLGLNQLVRLGVLHFTHRTVSAALGSILACTFVWPVGDVLVSEK